MQRTPRTKPEPQTLDARGGFTLVELLIVVVILGVLAAVVTASFSSTSVQARQQAFVSNLQTFADACELSMLRTGRYPVDASSGNFPAELAEMLDPSDWENGTPIGGVWYVEYNDSGVGAAVGVHFDGTGETRDDAFMTEVDAIFDGGNIEAGAFQRIAAGRYYWILEP